MSTTISSATGTVIGAWARRKWFKILIDVALFVGFVADFLTREGPDYALHSWIGIVLVPVIALHLVGNVGWIRRVWAKGRQDREFGLGVLNAVLGVVATVCILTGFPIWLEWSESGFWSGLHTITGFVSLVLMFVHLGKNRKRLVRLVR